MAVNDLHEAQRELAALTRADFQAGWKIVQERMRASLDGVMVAADYSNPSSCVAAVAAYRNIVQDAKTVEIRIERLNRTIKEEIKKLDVKPDSEQSL